MTVLENIIEAPMRVKSMSRRNSVNVAEDLLEKIGLIEKRDIYPGKLSGGQQRGCHCSGARNAAKSDAVR